jgi:hypothetical protein
VFSGAAVGDWSEVTLLDCLNMATGNYQSSGATQNQKRIFFGEPFFTKKDHLFGTVLSMVIFFAPSLY